MTEAQTASGVGAREITYFQAIFEAHQEEMRRDERVVLIGEDISLYPKSGILDAALSDRIFSAPISENGFCGMGVGAAMTGLSGQEKPWGVLPRLTSSHCSSKWPRSFESTDRGS